MGGDTRHVRQGRATTEQAPHEYADLPQEQACVLHEKLQGT